MSLKHKTKSNLLCSSTHVLISSSSSQPRNKCSLNLMFVVVIQHSCYISISYISIYKQCAILFSTFQNFIHVIFYCTILSHFVTQLNVGIQPPVDTQNYRSFIYIPPHAICLSILLLLDNQIFFRTYIMNNAGINLLVPIPS